MAGKDDKEDCHPNFEILRRDQEMRLGFMTEVNFLNTMKRELEALERKGASAARA